MIAAQIVMAIFLASSASNWLPGYLATWLPGYLATDDLHGLC